jgi:hypothetical protein
MIICNLQLDYPKNSFLKACKLWSDSINYGSTSTYNYHVDSPLK